MFQILCIQEAMFRGDVYDTNVSWGDDLDDNRYHVHIESCLGALHTFCDVVKCVIYDYEIGEP